MNQATRKPQLYVIAGPNGAGKTMFAREFLPHQHETGSYKHILRMA